MDRNKLKGAIIGFFLGLIVGGIGGYFLTYNPLYFRMAHFSDYQRYQHLKEVLTVAVIYGVGFGMIVAIGGALIAKPEPAKTSATTEV